MRIILAGLICLVGCFALDLGSRAEGVRAHALLDHSEPAEGAQLTQPPSALTLYFAQAVLPDAAYSYVLVRDTHGSDLAGENSFDPAFAKLIRVALPALPPGVYTVKWQTRSADDDDIADGSYKITVLNPDGSQPTDASVKKAGANDSGGAPQGWLIALVILWAVAVAGGLWLWKRRVSK